MMNAKKYINGMFTMFICGLSAISLFPSTNYGQNTYKSQVEISNAGWNMTGRAMRQAFDSAKDRYGNKQ